MDMMNKAWFLGAFLAMGVSSPAWAQDTSSVDAMPLGAKASLEDMKSYVRNSLGEMVNGVKSMGKMVEQARREGDEEKLACLQSRLSYVRALLMVSERANGAMKEAVASGMSSRAEHEFRKVAVALSKVRQFLAEAETCLGEEGTTPGTTELNVDDQSGLEDGDDTDPMDDYFVVVGDDPTHTSPFE
jgi:hypothetical protein